MEYIQVNFKNLKGAVKPMHSVNNGPGGLEMRGISNFDAFKEAHIPYVRNHDAAFYSEYGGEHTVDVHRIFRNFDADENDPASYMFAPTDAYLARITAAGSKVFYRLGATIEHGFKFGTYPPKDFAKWARICEHIIRHYNEGWADGFYYGIEYWEIWNEPECRDADQSRPCWQGTDEQFIDLFVTTLRHLKNCFPNLKIGGPALCSAWWGEWNKMVFDAVKNNGLSLDFFSFHGYAVDPDSFRKAAQKIREELDAYGFTSTEVILNEWNYVKGWQYDEWKYTLRMEKGLKGASFITASMICAQDSPMDLFMYYDCRPCEMNGMFDTDTLLPLKGYYPFTMFNRLYEIGTEAVVSCDCDALYAMAAVDENTGAVLITNYSDDDTAPMRQVKLSLTGLKEGMWKVRLRVLDETHDNAVIEEKVFKESETEMEVNIPLFGVVLITLEKTDLI